MELKQLAINYIKNLNIADKNKLKVMINHGIVCGNDYAKKNEIEAVELTSELKKLFGGN